MDFDLTDEQRLLAEAVGRFVTDRYDFASRASRGADTWAELAGLGLLGIGFAEEDGGFGGGGIERMIVAEAFGRGLVDEPWLATAILAGGALRLAGSAEQKAARIERIIGGEHRMALAHGERHGLRHALEARGVSAAADGDGWRISGEKIAVIHGAAADEFVVTALVDGTTGLFLVAAGDAGVDRATVAGYDGQPVTTVRFDGARAERLGGDAGAALAAVFDEATAVVCAEAVGAMAELVDLTGEYLKTRKQFGVALGSFQALQHRLVDMYMQLELSRSAAMHAALAVDQPAAQRSLNIAAAKAQIGRAGRMVGQNAVQLHGAIGFTDELKVGHLFKRLTAIDALFGDADHHIGKIARAGGLPAL